MAAGQQGGVQRAEEVQRALGQVCASCAREGAEEVDQEAGVGSGAPRRGDAKVRGGDLQVGPTCQSSMSASKSTSARTDGKIAMQNHRTRLFEWFCTGERIK